MSGAHLEIAGLGKTFRGLRARGGLEINLAWENGKATMAVLKGTLDRTYQIAAPKGQTIKSLALGVMKPVSAEAADEIDPAVGAAGRIPRPAAPHAISRAAALLPATVPSAAPPRLPDRDETASLQSVGRLRCCV